MRLTQPERLLRASLLQIASELPQAGCVLGKTDIRELHRAQRLARIASLDGSFDTTIRDLRINLASPGEVVVDSIRPQLVPVHPGTADARVFTAATITWSVPVSQGFGRRMRYLVRDEHNGKLIGIIGLTDPVFNLRPRDAWVGWSSDQRKERLVHVMDAFVLGALPPYSHLLGGKLVASLATSAEVVTEFSRRYGARTGIISGKRKAPRLAMLTTTSALGRSSMYNRLRLPSGVAYLTDIDLDRVASWRTLGYGHFHIDPATFRLMQRLLERREHPYARGNRFGDGPNWKIRVIRRAAAELGVPTQLLRHGIQRQVYVVPLASNARDFLQGRDDAPSYWTLTADEIAAYWIERWARPRATRMPNWTCWSPADLMGELHALRSAAAHVGGDDVSR